MPDRPLPALLYERSKRLTEGQRKVAAFLSEDPEAVAFGTTASVAEQAGTSGPTVVRFAMALGYSGFAELQEDLRREVASRARSAVGRLRGDEELAPALARISEIDQANVRSTFEHLDAAAFDTAVDLLADPGRRVWVQASTQTAGAGEALADALLMARDGVALVTGSHLRMVSVLAAAMPPDVLVTIDGRRHERAMVGQQRPVVARGITPVVITDREPCAYDATGGALLTFAGEPVGPFDSLVGLVSLTNALRAAVGDRLRPALTRRLQHLEAAWSHGEVYGPERF